MKFDITQKPKQKKNVEDIWGENKIKCLIEQ